MPEYTRPMLYAKQAEALFCPQRWGLIEASTKSGKTVGSIAWILEQAFKGRPGWNYLWVAPIAEQAKIAYTRIKAGLTKGAFSCLEAPTPRITLLGGQIIHFKSGDNPDSIYGEDYHAAVVDEASRCKPEVWHAVRSTLTATRGPCRIIGNVKGRRNWFYEFSRKIEAGVEPNGHFAKITAQDAVDAGVIHPEEVEDARRNLPENIFRELYMAEPGDDAGNPFGIDHIYACVNQDGLSTDPIVAWGIDLAKHQDWFVSVGLDEQCRVAAFHRWRGVPWRDSIRRVWKLVGEDVPALVDSTGVGDPVLEELQHEHGNFLGFHFGPASKQKLMEGLAVSIQSREISYPDGQIKVELEVFEYEVKQTRTGVQYSAPPGHNDDCVCALALARQMWSETAPGANVMAYYAAQSEKMRKQNNQTPTSRPGGLSSHTIGEEFENELTKLYEETVAKTLPAPNGCAYCHKPIGNSRITDGEHAWHVDCPQMLKAA